jgi:hypothetical protein
VGRRLDARTVYIGKDTPLIGPGVDTIDITAGTSLFAFNQDLYVSSSVSL